MTRIAAHMYEVIAFIIFIIAGFWIGSQIKQNPTAQMIFNQPDDLSVQIPSLPDGERIILVIGTDRLDITQPQLESIWLLTYYLQNKPIQLIPLYPSATTTASALETNLLNSFSMVNHGDQVVVNPDFLDLLSENNFWFSGYVVIDQTAASQLINLIGGLQTDRGSLSGEQILRELPRTSENPLAALTQQAVLLGRACQTLSRRNEQPQWSIAWELIPDHLITDLDPIQLIAEYQSIGSGPTPLSCEFPTIPTMP
jgi:hypothetical protein